MIAKNTESTFVPWGNALLATTILFTLAERSSSSFFAATVIGVEMAVGVIDAMAVVDAFGVFGVLAAAVAIAPLTIAADAATDVAALVAVLVVAAVVFGFFLIVLPILHSISQRTFSITISDFHSYQIVDGE